MKKISLIPVLVVGALLIYAADDFPEWGSPSAPASASPALGSLNLVYSSVDWLSPDPTAAD